MFIVDIAIMYPSSPTSNGATICQYRSPCLSECLETKKAHTAATMNGGATKIRVIVGLNPNVAVRVGKNALKERALTWAVSITASHQTFQSDMANQKPSPWLPRWNLFGLSTTTVPGGKRMPFPFSASCRKSLLIGTVSSWSPSWIPPSSAMRRIASFRSSGLSHLVVVGKSGRMKIAANATAIVRLPSM